MSLLKSFRRWIYEQRTNEMLKDLSHSQLLDIGIERDVRGNVRLSQQR